MDLAIFKKLKAKSGFAAAAFFAPMDYPKDPEMSWDKDCQADFVHLFVESQEQFKERFAQAVKAHKSGGLFWISYPKSKGKQKFDINRDSLWGLLLQHGFHPVAQVSLNDDWSAVRVKINEKGKAYERPGNVKRG